MSPIPPPFEGPIRRTLTVLVVEDHDDTRDVLARLLRMMGHRPVPAATCADAMALAAAHRPDADGAGPIDLVLGDIGLPDGDGIELMRRLRAAVGCRTVVLSGHGSPQDLERSRAAGIELHLVKPVTVDALRAVLESARRAA
jgi:CheY-like chemotaxis protein